MYLLGFMRSGSDQGQGSSGSFLVCGGRVALDDMEFRRGLPGPRQDKCSDQLIGWACSIRCIGRLQVYHSIGRKVDVCLLHSTELFNCVTWKADCIGDPEMEGLRYSKTSQVSKQHQGIFIRPPETNIVLAQTRHHLFDGTLPAAAKLSISQEPIMVDAYRSRYPCMGLVVWVSRATAFSRSYTRIIFGVPGNLLVAR